LDWDADFSLQASVSTPLGSKLKDLHQVSSSPNIDYCGVESLPPVGSGCAGNISLPHIDQTAAAATIPEKALDWSVAMAMITGHVRGTKERILVGAMLALYIYISARLPTQSPATRVARSLPLN
jgi:hypothetical protein